MARRIELWILACALRALPGCAGTVAVDAQPDGGAGGQAPLGCGDGTCAAYEDQHSCAADCGAVQVSAGETHACALLGDGAARCWGHNGDGELGVEESPLPIAHPVAVSSLRGAAAISAGDNYTCALLADATVKCWGNNDTGQLGDGSNTSSHAPVTVAGVSGAVAISAGRFHACAVLSDGTARCWGANDSGQLGDGSTASSHGPVVVSNLAGAVSVAAGFAHTCAVLSDGTARCWGASDVASGPLLGDGTGVPSSVPVVVSGLTQVAGISVSGHRSCASRSDGSAWCWGDNGDCLLGADWGHPQVPVPAGGFTATQTISVGANGMCAMLLDGTVACRGEGLFGGGSTDSLCGADPAPWTVFGLTGVVSLSANHAESAYACASRADGGVSCWGDNEFSQLGDGTDIDSTEPVEVLAW